jgi:CheY-like chemotaxis protein
VRHRKVLVVEDDHLIREAIAEALDEEGFEVVEAANGREALEKLHAQPGASLVLLDLMMPVMDGWRFREAQLRDPELANIPVVVLSAVKDENVPAERHFSKPCDLDELLDTVWEFTGGP